MSGSAWDDLAANLPDPEANERRQTVSASQALVDGGHVATPEALKPSVDWSELTKDLPATQELLSDPARAAAVKDDVTNLAPLEYLFRGWRDIGWETAQAWKRGRAQDRLAQIGYLQSIGAATPEMIAEADRLEALTSSLAPVDQGLFSGVPAAVAESAPMMIGSAADSGREVSTGAAAGLAAGAAAGGVTGPGAVATAGAGLVAGAGLGLKTGMTVEMGKREKGLAYREYMQIPGVTHAQAAAASTIVGIANGFLEVLPLDLVLQVPGLKALLQGKATKDVFRRILGTNTGRAAMARAAARLAGGVTVEGLTEAAQEISTIEGGFYAEALAKGGYQGRQIDWDRVLDAFIKGGQAGGGMGAPGIAAGFVADQREVAAAKERAQFWTALGETAAASTTLRTMPEESRAHVEEIQARHGGPVSEVSVPAQALQTLFQGDEELSLDQFPAVAKQLEEAAANPGLEVTVPVADMARIATSKAYPALVPDIRVGDQLTLREAEQVHAESKAFADEDAKREAKEVEQTPEQRVVADVAAKLEAAGKDPEQARAQAAVWGAFAKVIGKKVGAPDAWAFYQAQNLSVQSTDQVELGEGETALVQPTAAVEVKETEAGGYELRFPGQPMALELEVAEGAIREPMLKLGVPETKENIARHRGQGYSTALYLRALRIAKERKLGWESMRFRSPATERMYARLRELGVPVEEVGGRYRVTAEALAALDLDQLERLNEAEAEIKALRVDAVVEQLNQEGREWTSFTDESGRTSFVSTVEGGDPRVDTADPFADDEAGVGGALDASSPFSDTDPALKPSDVAAVRQAAAPPASDLQAIREETGMPVRDDGTINAGEAAGVIFLLYQTRDAAEWLDTFEKNRRVQEVYTAEDLAKLRRGITIARQVMQRAIDSGILPEEYFRDADGKPLSQLRTNADFIRSLDITTICPRQDTFTATVHEVERRRGKLLSPEQRHLVGLMIRDAGAQPACWYCYGQAGRNAYDAVIGKVTRVAQMYLDLMRETGGKATGAQLAAIFQPATGEWRWNPRGKLAEWFKENWRALEKEGVPNEVRLRDIARGYAKADGELEASFGAAARAFAQGATHANDPKGWASLKQQITRMSQRLVDVFNARAGLRMNSQTDFRPWHVIETTEAVASMFARRLFAHVYTKEADFLRIFGKTGIKFNLSALYVTEGGRVKLDKRGRPVFDSVMGMAGEEIERWVKELPRDAGGMLVAVNDEALLLGLLDDRIHQIIPYHAGAVPGSVDAIEGARDYSSLQHETGWVTRKVDDEGKALGPDEKSKNVQVKVQGTWVK